MHVRYPFSQNNIIPVPARDAAATRIPGDVLQQAKPKRYGMMRSQVKEADFTFPNRHYPVEVQRV